MGLDIYLYEAAEHEKSQAYAAWWDREDNPGDREAPEPGRHVDVPSVLYPDHLCNRRYLRSSYNSDGFNSAVPQFVGADHGFYWIFQGIQPGQEYEIELTAASIPDLLAARDRALRVAQELRDCDRLKTMSASLMVSLSGPEHLWRTPPKPEEVLAWYREEVKRFEASEHRAMFGEGYSNAKGSVFGFTSGLEVLALAVGNDFGPAAIAVFRVSENVIDSYVGTAMIAAEFCEEAIGLINADGRVFIHWSG